MNQIDDELRALEEEKRKKKHTGPNNTIVWVILIALSVYILSVMFSGCQHRAGLKPQLSQETPPHQSDIALKGPVAGWTCTSCGYFNLVDNKQIRHCGVCGAAR